MSSCFSTVSVCHQLSIAIRSSIAVELPGVSYFANQIQIQIRDHQRILITGRLRNDLSARIAEITLAIELADVPGPFVADAINRAHEVSVGDGVPALLPLPELF